MPSLATLLLYLLAGTAVGMLALLSGIPAAPLAGALVGAGFLSMSGQLEPATWPSGTRTALEIGIGTVIGTGLRRTSLEQLQSLWKPALLITLCDDAIIRKWGRPLIENPRKSFENMGKHKESR